MPINKSFPKIFLAIPQNQEKNLNFFWLGFAIYAVSSVFLSSFRSGWILFQGIETIAIVIIVTTSVKLIKFDIENSYLRNLFYLYCLWSLTIFFRDYNLFTDYTYIKTFLFDTMYGGMLYFAPFILLFPKRLSFYKKLFNVIIIFGILFLFFSIILIKDLLQSDPLAAKSSVEVLSDLSFPCGFILLTFFYHKTSHKIFAVIVIITILLFASIRARRGLLLMNVEMIFFSYILLLLFAKKRHLIIYFTILISLLGLLYINNVYKPENSKIYGYLLDRGTADTRTGVELYFYDDMKQKDWIIGKGLRGKYFCPNIEPDQMTNYRTVIETGYLQTILNGGLISLGLQLLMSVPAIFLGIFFSKNILSKAAGIWILLSIVDSYPGTINGFTFRYLLVWISIGICFSGKIRNIPEFQLKKYFLETEY